MRKGSRRPALVAAAVLLIAVIAALVWWGWPSRAAAPVTEQATSTPQRPSWPLPVVAASGPAVLPAAVRPRAAASNVPDGYIEVCGRGWVAPPPDPAASGTLEQIRQALAERPRSDWELQWEQEARVLRTRSIEALAASGDEMARLLGLFLQDDRAGVAALAGRSTDARVYAQGWHLCAAGPAKGQAPAACQQLSLRRWAQLEPDNAWPWMELAGAARERHDHAGEAEALYQASQARRVDGGWGLLSSGLAEHLPDDASPGGRSMLLMEVFGREMGMPRLAPMAAARACGAEQLRDANRRQVCGTLAGLLMREGRGLLDVAVGIGMGERLGLPEREMPVTRAALKLAQEQAGPQFPPERLMSCEGLRYWDGWLRELGREGEWRALQARVRTAASAP